MIYFRLLALALCCFSITSCYRVPTEYDYCKIPVTNNPSITREKPASPLPGMKY